MITTNARQQLCSYTKDVDQWVESRLYSSNHWNISVSDGRVSSRWQTVAVTLVSGSAGGAEAI